MRSYAPEYFFEYFSFKIIQPVGVNETSLAVLLHLAKYPFRDACGIMLESGASSLVLDGIKPFDDIVFFEYEGTVGQSNIVLNGTMLRIKYANHIYNRLPNKIRNQTIYTFYAI